MKRFLITILASTFLLPVCGSVLVFASAETNHDHGSRHSIHEVSMDMSGSDMDAFKNEPVSISPACDQHISASSNMRCCDASHTNSKIGIWQKWENEPVVHHTSTAPFLAFQDMFHEKVELLKIHPSTAPPPHKQTYTSLIGIIKSLN